MNQPSIGTHLNEDQLADWLLADHTPAVAAHMASCAACRQRAVAFTSTLTSFNQASLGWAEARSNSIPVSSPSASHHPAFWRPLPVPALVLIAALLAGAGARWTHHQPATNSVMSAASLSPQSEPSLSGDNALLAEIDAALAPPEHSPLDAYTDGNQPADDAHLAPAGH